MNKDIDTSKRLLDGQSITATASEITAIMRIGELAAEKFAPKNYEKNERAHKDALLEMGKALLAVGLPVIPVCGGYPSDTPWEFPDEQKAPALGYSPTKHVESATVLRQKLRSGKCFALGIIATPGLIVVDADTPLEVECFKAWWKQHTGTDAPAWTVSTPGVSKKEDRNFHSEGGHLYLRIEDATALPATLKATEKVEVTLENGDTTTFDICIHSKYLIAPGSTRAEGAYTLTGEVVDAPKEIIQALAERAEKQEITTNTTASTRKKSTYKKSRGASTSGISLDEWQESTTWLSLLERAVALGTGWKIQKIGTCSGHDCIEVKAPDTSSDRSAVAHTKDCPHGHGTGCLTNFSSTLQTAMGWGTSIGKSTFARDVLYEGDNANFYDGEAIAAQKENISERTATSIDQLFIPRLTENGVAWSDTKTPQLVHYYSNKYVARQVGALVLGGGQNVNALEDGVTQYLQEFENSRAEYVYPKSRVFVNMESGKKVTYVYTAHKTSDTPYIRIDENGWRYVRSVPENVFFFSMKNDGVITPNENAELKDILEIFTHMNIPRGYESIVLGSMVLQFIRPENARPILYFDGEGGSGKSVTTQRIRAMLDPLPGKRQLESFLPDGVKELKYAAVGRTCQVWGNISETLPRSYSDAMCVISTGGVSTVRKLYSDDETIDHEIRALQLISTTDKYIKLRNDFQTRTIRLQLHKWENHTSLEDYELDDLWVERFPVILGGLYCLASAVMKKFYSKDFVRQDAGYRMGALQNIWSCTEEILRELEYKYVITTDTGEKVTREMESWSTALKRAQNSLQHDSLPGFLAYLIDSYGNDDLVRVPPLTLLKKLQHHAIARGVPGAKDWTRDPGKAGQVIERNKDALEDYFKITKEVAKTKRKTTYWTFKRLGDFPQDTDEGEFDTFTEGDMLMENVI